MKQIEIAYGRDLDDSMLEQLLYMEADAYVSYDTLNQDTSDKHVIVGIIPTETLKHYKRRVANILFLMKTVPAKPSGQKLKRRLVAMACISKEGTASRKHMCFHTFYVKPLYRKKGIGTAIVSKALSIAKRDKLKLSLNVNPLNDEAIRLYESCGFAISKEQNIRMEAFPSKRRR